MGKYDFENRKFVIGGAAVFIVIVFLIRLFTLQLMSDDYKKNADSNAFLKRPLCRCGKSTEIQVLGGNEYEKDFVL